jgi:DNA transformation protein
MARDPELEALLEEYLSPLGPVLIRRMFGGVGLFLDGIMFGLVADGVLHFKADDINRPAFEAEGLEPFTYRRKGSLATLTSYWRAPDRLLDEPDEMLRWSREAHAAALRSVPRRRPASTNREKPTRRARSKKR